MRGSPQQAQGAHRRGKAGAWRWLRLRPFAGVCSDVRGRVPWYGDDWRQGLNCGVRVLAPATYIFFASALPLLAFGQQISQATDGTLTAVQLLAASAATGVLQAVVGGQPLLIVGVSEPITLIYSYSYSFASGRPALGQRLFLPWMAWTCAWAGAMLVLLAALNACRYAGRFTRLSGELFGALIAVLFMQQAIKGTLGEFRPEAASDAAANAFEWRLANGLWALLLAFGTVLCALGVQRARRWRFLLRLARGFLADYGVPLAAVAWSGLSFALRGTPRGIPRRLSTPNTWEVHESWRAAGDMAAVPGPYIAAALIPALLIAILFYFDHTVSAQMAQLPEFGLVKPPAYDYDLLLLGLMTLGCGLVGLPPVNGVLPQAPLHTRSLITLREQVALSAVHRAAREHRGSQAELLEHMAEACHRRGATRAAEALSASTSLSNLQGGATTGPAGKAGGEADSASASALADVEEHVLAAAPPQAQDQRVTNLVQSLLIGACLGITPALKQIPTAVLWGYFAYLSLASLPGSQFWERILLCFVDPSRRPPKFPGQAEAPWLGKIRWRAMLALTAFQAAYCGAVYGITWIPIAGVVFPVPILLLIPLREHLLPRVLGRRNMAALDPAPFEDEEGRRRPRGRALEAEGAAAASAQGQAGDVELGSSTQQAPPAPAGKRGGAAPGDGAPAEAAANGLRPDRRSPSSQQLGFKPP